MHLYNRVQILKKDANEIISGNPLLDAFRPELCGLIDLFACRNPFYAEKKKAILNYIKSVSVHHDPKIKQALDE